MGHTRPPSFAPARLMSIELRPPLYYSRQLARRAYTSRALLLTLASSLMPFACPPRTLVAVHCRPSHQQCSPNAVAMQSPTSFDSIEVHRPTTQFLARYWAADSPPSNPRPRSTPGQPND